MQHKGGLACAVQFLRLAALVIGIEHKGGCLDFLQKDHADIGQSSCIYCSQSNRIGIIGFSDACRVQPRPGQGKRVIAREYSGSVSHLAPPSNPLDGTAPELTSAEWHNSLAALDAFGAIAYTGPR